MIYKHKIKQFQMKWKGESKQTVKLVYVAIEARDWEATTPTQIRPVPLSYHYYRSGESTEPTK